ncbi:hypothetical protein LINGRAHAP2_LOCUS2980 [Linum grandiflorum]
MKNCCLCRSGKAGKGAREEEEEDAAADKLSYLPDFILYHILSFLDTKCVVQTSVLSRRWRIPVCKICFVDVDEEAPWQGRYKDVFSRVVQYASSNGTQHFAASLEAPYTFMFIDDESIKSLDMETLELNGVIVPNGLASNFPMLTTLKLENSGFGHNQEGVFDLFSNFPCLTNLVISGCAWSYTVSQTVTVYSTKIIGSQLLSLKLDVIDNLEIVAPRLKFLNLEFNAPFDDYFQGFSKLSIPSLVRADYLLLERYFSGFRDNKEMMDYSMDNLFRDLHNATSLVVRSDDNQLLQQVCEYMEQNQSSFARLKSFECKSYHKVATLSEESCG